MTTCLTLQRPAQGSDRAYIQTSLLVNDGCRNGPNIILNVTVNTDTGCNKVLAVADPGFPRRGGANPPGGGANLLFCPILTENCMKMK